MKVPDRKHKTMHERFMAANVAVESRELTEEDAH